MLTVNAGPYRVEGDPLILRGAVGMMGLTLGVGGFFFLKHACFLHGRRSYGLFLRDEGGECPSSFGGILLQ